MQPTWTPWPGFKRPAARSGQWHLSPSTMKKSDIVWYLLQRCLDILQSYSELVWYLAAILDALSRLQTTISRARSTPTKFFTARSLRQRLLYMYYLNFSTMKSAPGIRVLPAEVLEYHWAEAVSWLRQTKLYCIDYKGFASWSYRRLIQNIFTII